MLKSVTFPEAAPFDVRHDVQNDVLYVKQVGALIRSSRSIDGDLVLNLDEARNVVGLQLMEVGEMTLGRWVDYFQQDVPRPLFETVAEWLKRRGTPSRRPLETAAG
jgi:uncharacterized protein YuzE